ncbi:MAG TPA: tetratricopeptide repeat protein [Flavisolibacter sp.]|nr:tetratricopeptide repeat protein [Flavisolibacter sp.]
MIKTITTLLLILSSFTLAAQESKTFELKVLLESRQYDKIIEQYAPTPNDLSAKALFYIGYAYFMKEDDLNCIRFMDLSIAKDPKDPLVHYTKAATLNYTDRYEEAIKAFQIAISLKADNAEYYSGLGDAYYQLKKYEQALEAYQKATEQAKVLDRPYSMIAQIYSELKENKKALAAFYTAKANVSKESDSYRNALFNIGTLESLAGNHDKAEPAFLELLQLDSTDYHSYSKLIQIYNHQKAFDKIKPYKDKLYEAHRNGQLKDNLEDMFCFAQFKWNDKRIHAFERFEEGNKEKIYYKHIFYIINNDDQVEYRIQTEYSPIAAELGSYKYVLGMNKGSMHYTFPIGFKEHPDYDTLKQAVIDILEGKLKPSSSSGKSK